MARAHSGILEGFINTFSILAAEVVHSFKAFSCVDRTYASAKFEFFYFFKHIFNTSGSFPASPGSFLKRILH